jgi:hypothetical protein
MEIGHAATISAHHHDAPKTASRGGASPRADLTGQ